MSPEEPGVESAHVPVWYGISVWYFTQALECISCFWGFCLIYKARLIPVVFWYKPIVAGWVAKCLCTSTVKWAWYRRAIRVLLSKFFWKRLVIEEYPFVWLLWVPGVACLLSKLTAKLPIKSVLACVYSQNIGPGELLIPTQLSSKVRTDTNRYS